MEVCGRTGYAALLTLLFATLYLVNGQEPIQPIPLLMPNVQPTVKETYLCTGFKMPIHEHLYIVGFEPNATQQTAHHILIYGCSSPGYWERDTPRITWDCGEMSGSKSQFRHKPVCASGSQVIYAWAKDAPALKLPDGVGFKVGKDTGISFLVLQVHYAHVDKFLNGATDDSGIVLQTLPGDSKKVTKGAGVMLLGTGGYIRPKSTVYMETACSVEEDYTLHPFAFRTHTHKLGLLVSGYVVKSDNSWTRIGKHDPQKPQMFYPVENKNLAIKKGDVLTARCTMRNYQDHVTRIGSTADDEMCNFYMMYYVEGEHIPNQKYCFSAGPPMYSWNYDEKLRDVPAWVDRDASTADN